MRDYFDPQSLTHWPERLRLALEAMRELSYVRDPQSMNAIYARWMGKLLPTDRVLALSRRNLKFPYVRITRDSQWPDAINPWIDPGRLPILNGGIFAEWIYKGVATICNDPDTSRQDPARDYLLNQVSVMVIPQLENGEAINMLIALRSDGEPFSPELFPDIVWMSNLFGRATQSTVVSERLKKENELADFELQAIGRMQAALLPQKLPQIPTLDLAVKYQTTDRAGGDYYDIFALPKGRWGLFIADVSGHGTSAAVVTAVLHTLMKTYTGPPWPPGLLLASLNQHLARYFTRPFGSFVTAFFAVYDPFNGTLQYANAGHQPARLLHHGEAELISLEGTPRLPLGVSERSEYPDATVQLRPGDCLVILTDGIIEPTNNSKQDFGLERLDRAILQAEHKAEAIADAVIRELDQFTGSQKPPDDRTLIVGRFHTGEP